jgi:Ca2+:H+ antiporter
MFKLINQERALIIGLLTIAMAYFLMVTDFIGPIGHFGGATVAVFFSIITVIFYITKHVVENAEILAKHYGEPYGTLILILAASAIEVIMVVTIMLYGPGQEPMLARDSVFSGIILSVNCLLGLSLLIGGLKYGEQKFNEKSSHSYLAKLGVMCALGLLFPMVIHQDILKYYKIFIIILFPLLYGFFLFGQIGKYSYFFTYENPSDNNSDAELLHKLKKSKIYYRISFLFIYLIIIALLVEFLAITIDDSISYYNLPNSVAAFLVALISKAPESLAAMRATMRNNMQLSINIALSSALSTMGLTIPAVLIVSFITGINITIGCTQLQALLLSSTVIIAYMNKSSGKTNAYGGAIQFALFLAYLFTLTK